MDPLRTCIDWRVSAATGRASRSNRSPNHSLKLDCDDSVQPLSRARTIRAVGDTHKDQAAFPKPRIQISSLLLRAPVCTSDKPQAELASRIVRREPSLILRSLRSLVDKRRSGCLTDLSTPATQSARKFVFKDCVHDVLSSNRSVLIYCFRPKYCGPIEGNSLPLTVS